MASERVIGSCCHFAHLSTVSRNSFDSRMAVTGSRPVAGRPRPFLGTTLFDFAIKCSTIKASRGEVTSFRPGSNSSHLGYKWLKLIQIIPQNCLRRSATRSSGMLSCALKMIWATTMPPWSKPTIRRCWTDSIRYPSEAGSPATRDRCRR
jgi:hypothetical protein